MGNEMNLFAMLRKALRRAPQKFLQFARTRKKWSNPSRAKIVIFDSMQANVLIPLFKGEHYEIVCGPEEEIYITPGIIFSTIRYALKTRDLVMAYIIAVLDRIEPSIVVTFIDNSHLFQKVASCYKNARFLAIQNGSRFFDMENPPGSPVIYHSEFVCFGRYEVDQYTRQGAIVEKFYPAGSLKDSYHRVRRPAQFAEKLFDLCLVAQIGPQFYKTYPMVMESMDLLARHLKIFCERHGTTLCVASRLHPDRDKAQFEWQAEWFRDRLGDFPQIIPNVLEEYTSYSVIDSSRVSLGMFSTLLREGFGRRNRILSCNFTGYPFYDFLVDGPWSLNNQDYAVFEQRLLWLLNMTDDEFNSLCGDTSEYLIGYDVEVPTHVVVEELISEALRGVARPTSGRFVG
jgi:surface carbohydrate biosynthesis protein